MVGIPHMLTFCLFSPFPFMLKPPRLPWIEQRRLHPPPFMSKGSGEGWPPHLPWIRWTGSFPPLFASKTCGEGTIPLHLPRIQWAGSSPLPFALKTHRKGWCPSLFASNPIGHPFPICVENTWRGVVTLSVCLKSNGEGHPFPIRIKNTWGGVAALPVCLKSNGREGVTIIIRTIFTCLFLLCFVRHPWP